MQDFGYVRQLALKKKEYDIQIMSLKQQIQSQIAYQTAGAHADLKPNLLLNLGVFGVCELIFGFILKKVIGDIISKQMNNGLSFEDFSSAGGVGYHMAQVPWAIGAIAAIPISLVLMLLFMLVSKLWYKKRVQNDKKILDKESMLEKNNAEIRSYNQRIMEQVAVLEQNKSELLLLLRENSPWYPESHFFIEAVDFIMRALNSGQAQTIEQALSLYEINVAKQ